MKALSIPKLELQAALLATRLKEDVLKALTIPVSNTFMWTDRTTVLQWLNSDSKQPTFVANRIGEILESTTVDQWFHVLSGDNPADTGTRNLSGFLKNKQLGERAKSAEKWRVAFQAEHRNT